MRPFWYRVAAALAVTAMLAGTALALTLTAGPAPRGRAAAARPSHPGPASGPADRGRAPLRLAAGTRPVNGLYLGYPRSAVGAVSAAVEFVTELGSTLDPDRAATVARLVADPSYSVAPIAAAAGVASTRHRLGLPVAGPLPPGTAVSLVPTMFQVQDVTASRVTVLLLFDYTAMVPAGISERLGAMAAAMHWTQAGWRLLQPGAPNVPGPNMSGPNVPGPNMSGLIATPGTAAAAAKGWKAMTSGM
ncbi:MAG TPA: hypothetical protein VGI31_03750 [Streptosporangiaceae bacterium]